MEMVAGMSRNMEITKRKDFSKCFGEIQNEKERAAGRPPVLMYDG